MLPRKYVILSCLIFIYVIQAIYHKVIIVGGSLAGITLALALEHTDIDFILLERGDFAPFVCFELLITNDVLNSFIKLGTSLVISGCGMRILDQLGVAAKIIGVCILNRQSDVFLIIIVLSTYFQAGVKIKYARAVNEDGKFVFQLNIGPAVEEKYLILPFVYLFGLLCLIFLLLTIKAGVPYHNIITY